MRKQPWEERLVDYQFAEQVLQGRAVLEVGCGSGAGSYFLARTARTVTAVDPDAGVVERCQRTFSSRNLRFVHADPSRLELKPGSFDVVCVPLLERWPGRQEVLNQVRRMLHPEGFALFTVTSGDRPGSGEGVTYAELEQSLGQVFTHVRISGEIPFSGFTMADFKPQQELSPVLDCSLVDEDEPPTKYLALCGAAPLSSLGYAVIQVKQGEAEVARLQQQVAQWQSRCQADQWQMDELRGKLRAAEQRPTGTEAGGDEQDVAREEEAPPQQEAAATRERELAELRARADELSKENQDLFARVEECNTRYQQEHQKRMADKAHSERQARDLARLQGELEHSERGTHKGPYF